MVYNVEKMLRDHRSKISDADAKDIERALEDTKSAMKEGGVGTHQLGAPRKWRAVAIVWPRRCTRRPPPSSPGAVPDAGAALARPGRSRAKDNGRRRRIPSTWTRRRTSSYQPSALSSNEPMAMAGRGCEPTAVGRQPFGPFWLKADR